MTEDRQLSSVDFDYAFDEFKPISVKLLDDDKKKASQTVLHWSDIGGMLEVKQELIQTVQWRFEVSAPPHPEYLPCGILVSIPNTSPARPFGSSRACFSTAHRAVERRCLLRHSPTNAKRTSSK